GIGLFVLLPAVVMVDTLARAGRARDALALITRGLDNMSDRYVRLRAVANSWWAHCTRAWGRHGGGRALLLGRRCGSRVGKRQCFCNPGQVSRSRVTSPNAAVARKQGWHLLSAARAPLLTGHRPRSLRQTDYPPRSGNPDIKTGDVRFWPKADIG